MNLEPDGKVGYRFTGPGGVNMTHKNLGELETKVMRAYINDDENREKAKRKFAEFRAS